MKHWCSIWMKNGPDFPLYLILSVDKKLATTSSYLWQEHFISAWFIFEHTVGLVILRIASYGTC